jgi:hypothetical protein
MDMFLLTCSFFQPNCEVKGKNVLIYLKDGGEEDKVPGP